MLPSLPLIDSFGRLHNNLRISVTDRCNLRCFYCMPADNVQFMEKSELLAFEEIERFVRVAVSLGINKLRLTGGEPLVRRDLPSLVQKLTAIDGIVDVGLTTNGILLADQAQALRDAGLKRINISLDALSPEKFREFTRRNEFERVIQGIEAAREVGFESIKINAVSVRGMTETEVVPFGQFARQTGVEVRFIEYMPLDADNAWEREKVLFSQEIVEILANQIMPLIPVHELGYRSGIPFEKTFGHGGPASDFVFEDGIGRVGFISSISQPFCLSCNRVRITADGKLRNCLFSLEETDIRALLRGGETDEAISSAIRSSVAAKREGHEINTARFIQPERPMYSIGG